MISAKEAQEMSEKGLEAACVSFLGRTQAAIRETANTGKRKVSINMSSQELAYASRLQVYFRDKGYMTSCEKNDRQFNIEW